MKRAWKIGVATRAKSKLGCGRVALDEVEYDLPYGHWAEVGDVYACLLERGVVQRAQLLENAADVALAEAEADHAALVAEGQPLERAREPEQPPDGPRPQQRGRGKRC